LAEKGINSSSQITQATAIDLKEKCLNDLKQRIIDKANLIQRRFEKVKLFRNGLERMTE
jgi:hypothetical protein